MKKAIKFLTAAVVLGFAVPGWSAVPLENTLDPIYYDKIVHVPRIDMTNINLNYVAGKDGSGKFSGVSTSSSVLTLVKNTTTSTVFSGSFKLNADISSRGTFNSGSFSFKSSDPMFNFGVDKKGHAINGNVFSGKLTSFGWSDSRGFLEFGTSNFTGWACAQGWCTTAERLWFNTASGSLGLPDSINKIKNWSATGASGSAVIPVPAAVWLLGSGLMGLAGVARRKKKISA
jgi:hypothetical protein